MCNWSLEPATLNSTFRRVARCSLPSAPASRTISQDTFRRCQCNRTGKNSQVTGVLQLAISGTQTQQPVETYLGPWEWVTSLDLKDTYFHIPIHSQSRKYMRFHVQGRSYQFKALPFGLSTAPMEFTVVAKLMALQRGKRIHQYLDDWLVRAMTPQTCLMHTQTLVAFCQELGWLVKSELDPKQVFNFIRYQFNLKEGKVRPTSSLPEGKLHNNHLELKAVFLTLKEFQALCSNNIVLVVTDNTTVVAYINKERGGGVNSGSLCALLWRIRSWCTRNR